MNQEIQNQIDLLKKYKITNYSIENGIITINGSLDLIGLTNVPDSDFLKGTTINGSLDLSRLTNVPDSDFLKGTTINGWLDLSGLTNVPDSDFLKGTTINGWLDLRGLTNAPDSDFLKGTTINGSLDLSGLTNEDRSLLKSNIKQLEPGYNKEGGYCFFDKILSKVTKVSNHKGYTIYTTPFEYVVQQGNYTAHGKTVKKAIEDLEFKKISEKLKHEPITADTEFTFKYYRALTGACYNGMQSFADNNNISYTHTGDSTHPIKEIEPLKAKDLLPILEKSNAYGLIKFKQLVRF